MRILFLTQFFQPEPIFKGLPFARALKERGHSVQVLTGFPNYPGGKIYPGYRLRFLQREVIDGIPITRLPLFPSHDQSAVRRVANYLSFSAVATAIGPMITERPDVIYVYNLVTLNLAWRLLRLRHRCPIVLDVQDLWPESVASSGMMQNRALHGFLVRFCRRAYASADRLTVLSPGFKRHLVAAGIPAAKIDVIYNWCEELPAGSGPEQRSILRRRSGFEGRFNILFAGTMGKVQALDSVIEAAKEVQVQAPEVLFSFLGGGVEVEKLKARSKGMPNVQFLPKCSPADAVALIGVADALLVNLKKDALFTITIPSKTQTYLHAGKPILMGVSGDAADLVREAGAGVCFEPENARSLSAAVIGLARMSAEERARMGERGRAYYRDRLSFHQGVLRFEDVFRTAIAQADPCEALGTAV